MRYQKAFDFQLVTTLKRKINNDLDPIDCSDAGYISFYNDLLTIRRGATWPGPKCFLNLPSIMRGSLVHDALYQLIRNGVMPKQYKEIADMALYECCLEDGMQPLLAKCVFIAVTIFGKPNGKKKPKLITILQ